MKRQNPLKNFISIICILSLIFGLCAGLASCSSDEPDDTTQDVQSQESSGETEQQMSPETEAPTTTDEPVTEQPTDPPPEIRPVKPLEENNVLKIKTGKNQWEGVKITGEKMTLEMGKSYSFSFLAYSPDIEVGLVFQTNTVNDWNWNVAASTSAYLLQPPGWYEITGTLNLDNASVTGVPTLSLTKLGDGGVLDSEVAIFYIDDFVVTETDSDEVVFSDDFEGESTAFENNGGTKTIVQETEIQKAP